MATFHDVQTAKSDATEEFFLTDEQHQKLAAAVNQRFNLPFLSEEVEGVIMLKLVRAVDRNVYRFVPKEILELANRRRAVAPEQIVAAMRESLAALVSGFVPLPFLPPVLGREIIEFVLGFVLDALASQSTLDEKVAEFLTGPREAAL